MVTHLTERLAGQTDGKPKVFRDSVVNNLADFFQRFPHLNIRSNEQLELLVDQAQQIFQGVEPQTLRDDRVLRDTVASELSELVPPHPALSPAIPLRERGRGYI